MENDKPSRNSQQINIEPKTKRGTSRGVRPAGHFEKYVSERAERT